MVIFKDRKEAGQRLAKALAHLKDEAPVIVGLPRGGVPVAFEVANALGAPLDLALVRKIGAPGQPELAIGAVIDGDHLQVIVNRDIAKLTGAKDDYIQQETEKKAKEIEDRRRRYFRGRPRPTLKGRSVIIVDDGIATGATMRAALAGLRQAGVTRLVVAVPVSPPDTASQLRTEVDEFVSLIIPDFFSAVGRFYQDFSQSTDEEVVTLLDQALKRSETVHES